MSIEERAKKLSTYMDGDLKVHDANMEVACIEIATEQREIDIKAACNGFGKAYCNFEQTNVFISCNGYNFDRCKDCYRTENIRKAMMEE